MFALKPDDEVHLRRSRLMIGAGGSVLLYAGLFLLGQRFVPALPPVRHEPISMQVVRTALPRRSSVRERNDELVQRRKDAQRVKPQSKPPAARDSQVRPPEPAPEPPTQTVPLVTGLTLSSTTQQGHGPRYAVGNTLLGTPDRVAQNARDASRAPSADNAAERESQNPISSNPTEKQRVEAKLIRSIFPVYPLDAKRQGIEGVVVLSITIDVRGCVESARVLSGLGHGLDESAMGAVRESRWEPATLRGQPVRTTRRFNVRFTLES